MEKVEVKVVQKFKASPERVFDAWLNPKFLDRWMFGVNIPGEEVVSLALDPKVGGKFSFLVRRQGQEIDHVGTYLEIDRPRRLAFTWSIGEQNERSRVYIDFVPDGTGCIATLTHQMDPEWADYKDRTQNGWTIILGSLAKALDEIP